MNMLRSVSAFFWFVIFLLAGFGSFLDFVFSGISEKTIAFFKLALFIFLAGVAIGAVFLKSKPTYLLFWVLVVGASLHLVALVAFFLHLPVPTQFLVTNSINPIFERLGFSISWLSMIFLMGISSILFWKST